MKRTPTINADSNQSSFTVVRIAAVNPPEDKVVAHVALVERDYKILLLDCRLILMDRTVDLYVPARCLGALVHCYLDHGLRGTEMRRIMNEMVIAVCGHLGLECNRHLPEQVLNQFLRGPRWQAWIVAHPVASSSLEAALDYLASGRR
jgi:hypothetical protein